MAILSLNDTLVALKLEDLLADARLDELVRGNQISAMEAASLIKDNRYTYRICKRLTELGQALFALNDGGLRQAQRDLALNEDEIEAMTDHKVH